MNQYRIFSMLSAFMLLLSSCAWTSYKFSAVKPAELVLPSHINAIAVIDRSMPRDGYAALLESAVTGEYIGQDERCRRNAVDGIGAALASSPRVKLVQTTIQETGNSTGTGMPNFLPWSEVRNICNNYQADALLSLELLDSNNDVNCVTQKYTGKNKDGSTYTYYETTCTQLTEVGMGWRLYDPRDKKVLYERTFYRNRETKGYGKTELLALKNLPSTVETARNTSFLLGYDVGAKLVPTFITIERYFYDRVKGYKSDMMLAAEFAQQGKWDKATNVYQNILRLAAGNNKVCGRATYNLAVAFEAQGDLKKALEYARVASMRYGNSEAQTYISVLERRIAENQQVKHQMNNQ